MVWPEKHQEDQMDVRLKGNYEWIKLKNVYATLNPFINMECMICLLASTFWSYTKFSLYIYCTIYLKPNNKDVNDLQTFLLYLNHNGDLIAWLDVELTQLDDWSHELSNCLMWWVNKVQDNTRFLSQWYKYTEGWEGVDSLTAYRLFDQWT